MKPNSEDYGKLIINLTVAEFITLHRQLIQEKKYEHGYKGLAKILGCGRSKAYDIKASGIIDPAISQNGKSFTIDVEYALSLIQMNQLKLKSLKQQQTKTGGSGPWSLEQGSDSKTLNS